MGFRPWRTSLDNKELPDLYGESDLMRRRIAARARTRRRRFLLVLAIPAAMGLCVSGIEMFRHDTNQSLFWLGLLCVLPFAIAWSDLR